MSAVRPWDVAHAGEVDLTERSARLDEAEALLRRVSTTFVRTRAGWHGRTETSLSAVLADVRAYLTRKADDDEALVADLVRRRTDGPKP